MRLWLAFATIALLVCAATAGLSAWVLSLECERSSSEILRLALWRLDARATALLIAEAARPPEQYRSFQRPGSAFNLMLQQVEEQSLLLASPLLQLPPPPVRLHVELGTDGRLSSPQAPQGNWRDLAEARYVQQRDVEEGLARLERLERGGLARSLGSLRAVLPVPAVAPSTEGGQVPAVAPVQAAPAPQAAAKAMKQRDQQEYDNRSANALASQAILGNDLNYNGYLPPAREAVPVSGPVSAHWAGAELVLARRVQTVEGESVQAAVLDWPLLAHSLAQEVADLWPGARLEVLRSGQELPDRLAAIPARLVGPPPGSGASAAARWVLALAWGGVLLGLGGAVAVINALQRLSERRAAFVSAVTHELRTPLTALRLHADLLADERVGGDPVRRSEQVGVLRGEGTRLAHLVENVLDYARLERHRAPQARPVGLPELLEPLLPRLRERLAAAGVALTVEAVPPLTVRCDPGAVERILANLADNAAKYAVAGSRAEFSVRQGRERAELRLRDHGPGIAPDVRARLFAPFARSAEAAAGSAPGVGLGLALCRRLARAQGGDLRLDAPIDGGVEAVLELRLG